VDEGKTLGAILCRNDLMAEEAAELAKNIVHSQVIINDKNLELLPFPHLLAHPLGAVGLFENKAGMASRLS
jgi:hypothetical protein